MLLASTNGKKWKKDVMKKLSSFAKKCPLLLTITTGVYKSVEGVYIECNQSNERYFFRWIYNQDPKEFVHDIKTKLLKEYPRIIQTDYEDHKATPEEIAVQLEQGTAFEDVNYTIHSVKSSKLWRIDKVLPWNQVFILSLEGYFDKNGKLLPIEEPTQRKYKYKGAAVIFLRKYRQGFFKSPNEAGDVFFENSNLITTLKNKE